ncbi:MAG: GntR family transcriptional regulator, partial [Candidatus Atribacteria bacterium]|nr:GntR family transcriptional regulator [Candidatus Atribacteria bacterium]
MFKIEFKKIDKSNHIPAYYQLKEAIHTKIKDGEIQPGERLLS